MAATYRREDDDGHNFVNGLIDALSARFGSPGKVEHGGSANGAWATDAGPLSITTFARDRDGMAFVQTTVKIG